LTRQRGITYIQGRARFVDASTLQIDAAAGGTDALQFGHAILATGSSPTQLPFIDMTHPRVMDSTAALALDDIPDTMLVIGGGYIGFELGTAYAALGTRVQLVEILPELLPHADRDLAAILIKHAGSRFEHIMTGTRAANVTDTGAGLMVTFEGENASPKQATFDRVLVAVGRRPNTGDIGIENTRIKLDDQGFVTIDEQRRTAEPKIYAIGDVTGAPLLAHKASHEGRTVAEVIAGRRVAFQPLAIPAVVYTDPELAYCGLTERQAKDEGRPVRVAKFPWGASGRALTMGRDDGLTKIVIDPETGRVLGAGIVGPGAGELIAESVLAVEMGALASDVLLTIHPHPTLSETVMESAAAVFGESTHVLRRKPRNPSDQ
jgi:dihydrolipoamide dehydrogenase